METVVQILDAAELAPIMPIPETPMHSRFEGTLRPVGENAAGKAYAQKNEISK